LKGKSTLPPIAYWKVPRDQWVFGKAAVEHATKNSSDPGVYPVLSGTNGSRGPRVEELRKRMTQSEMIEWAALFNLRPWGEECDDIRHGILTMVVANSAYGSRALPPAAISFPSGVSLSPRAPLNAADLKARLAAYAAANEPS